MSGSQGSQCTLLLRKPLSQQCGISKWCDFGKTEGKKRQKHKVGLLSLMHKDIWSLGKNCRGSWLVFLVCSHCRGFDVSHKPCPRMLDLEASLDPVWLCSAGTLLTGHSSLVASQVGGHNQDSNEWFSFIINDLKIKKYLNYI